MPSPLRTPCGIALAALALVGCTRSRGVEPLVGGTAEFTVSAPVFLDAPLRVAFAAPIDPATWADDAVELVATDGPGTGVPARGTWRIVGAALEFVPALAREEPVATGGGLQPGTRYELRVQADRLRAVDGRALAATTWPFVTRTGQTPAQLFGRNPAGGPRLVAVEAAPRDDAGDWQLGRAFAASTMRLVFDQPLHPGASNLPRVVTAATPSPVRLVYDDPVLGAATAVDVDVELLRNDTEGGVVELRPQGPLPSRAVVRLHVAPTLRDLFGEDHAGAFVEPVRTFRTEADEAPRHDALVFDFAAGAELAAPDFAELPAVVEGGALRVPDTFPAVAADVGDWAPSGTETLLRTDEQQLVYQNGVVGQFAGGVLHVRNLHVPAGHVVRGVGPNPLVLVVDGDACIEGVLSVDGADASGENRSIFAYRGPGDVALPAQVADGDSGELTFAGARAGAAGGHGGRAAGRETSMPSFAGGSAPGVVNGGGAGGAATCGPDLLASGGGGGGGACQGDPWYPPVGGSTPFPQRMGIGGAVPAGAPAGGAPGSAWFSNGEAGDDFWGRAYVPGRRRVVLGELASPRGGSGGGSGGSWTSTTACPPPDGIYLAGAGGGGGGGVLVLQVRGRLTIRQGGRVSADGGDGVGGNGFLSPTRGSGGGGAGGTVVLMAGGGIELHVRGETFAHLDYDFCVSADGGICVTPGDVAPQIPSKYPANGQPTLPPQVYGGSGLGGFGGMGLVQLMVPVGRDNADGTNTVLDDAIDVVRDGVPLLGLDKQRYLGWRGFPDDTGVLVDDFGLPTGTIGGQGDIRPDPVLLPVPWAADGRARARSAWLSLGALHRRALTAPDGLPRAVVGIATTFGAHARADGWLPFGQGQLSASTSGVERLAVPATIAGVAIDTTTLAQPVLALALTADLPELAPGSYTGCVADLGAAVGGSWTRRRVLHSTARTLFVDGELALPDGAMRVQLLGWFAELAMPEPGSYVGATGDALPRANARIGFAFHRAPSTAATSGFDPDRLPPEVGTFLHDLTDPAVRTAIRAFGPRAVQWDVVLDGAFRTSPGDAPPPADAASAIALWRFFLPVRF